MTAMRRRSSPRARRDLVTARRVISDISIRFVHYVLRVLRVMNLYISEYARAALCRSKITLKKGKKKEMQKKTSKLWQRFEIGVRTHFLLIFISRLKMREGGINARREICASERPLTSRCRHTRLPLALSLPRSFGAAK